MADDHDVRSADWSIQEVPQEGAPFLLYRGVLVGRLYAGCPYQLMLQLLNGGGDG
jgi:hypothetical protein